MENTNHAHIGRLKSMEDLNPTEKVVELLKVENFEKVISIVENSINAVGAINENFIPLSKSNIKCAVLIYKCSKTIWKNTKNCIKN